MLNSLAPSTWSQYSKVWENFASFATQTLQTEVVLPILPFQMLLFLTSLHQKRLAVSTIRSAGSALSFLHRMKEVPDPMDSYLLKKFVQGLSNASVCQDIRLPITRAILHKMLEAIPIMGFTLYRAALLKSLYLTLFHGFLRIGEATSKSSASRPIQYAEVTISSATATIVLQHFKHSTLPHRIELQKEPGGTFCPVEALVQFRDLRGMCDGPFFSSPGGRPYMTNAAREDLRSVLSFCGLDTTRYKSHSFRIGAASDAAIRGFSDAQIRLMGRWHSDAFRQYIRLPY